MLALMSNNDRNKRYLSDNVNPMSNNNRTSIRCRAYYEPFKVGNLMKVNHCTGNLPALMFTRFDLIP